MTDYEFGQAVMQAAGCHPEYRQCRVTERDGSVQHYAASSYNELCHALGTKALVELCDPEWADPFWPQGFCELWDALEAKGYDVAVSSTPRMGQRAMATVGAEIGIHANRKAALVEAAGQALGVSHG